MTDMYMYLTIKIQNNKVEYWTFHSRGELTALLNYFSRTSTCFAAYLVTAVASVAPPVERGEFAGGAGRVTAQLQFDGVLVHPADQALHQPKLDQLPGTPHRKHKL
jgi:hypothetical protein